MNLLQPLRWLCLCAFAFSLSAEAGSPVWKVSKAGQQLFIGGTIHMLAKQDYPLPAAFDRAYYQAARLVLETDMSKLQSPEFQLQLLSQLTYSDGRNLQQVLSKKTYKDLEAFVASRGVPMAALINFKPGMVAMTLTMMELQRLELMGTGVDEFFSTRAVDDGKALGALETAEQQMAFIAAMGDGREDEMIAYTLTDIQNLSSMLQTMKRAWRQGDVASLQKVTLAPFKQDFPEIYRSLLVERNNNWLPQVEAMLKNKEVELVLVGMLHLAGEDSLLAALAERGYKVEMLEQ